MGTALADAGAHVVGASGMMDGQVGAVRAALDGSGHADTVILAYAAKYASALYGPFREAVDSALTGDRRTYQQDPANRRESLREVALDVAESADIVMIKPAGTSLDVIADVASAVDIPVAAYQVSGEYAMLEAAAAHGWIDRERAILETLTVIRRAGADMVLPQPRTEDEFRAVSEAVDVPLVAMTIAVSRPPRMSLKAIVAPGATRPSASERSPGSTNVAVTSASVPLRR